MKGLLETDEPNNVLQFSYHKVITRKEFKWLISVIIG